MTSGAGALLGLPVAVPLLAAGLAAIARRRPARRAISLVVAAGALGLGGALLSATHDGRVLTQRVGDWPTPVAIVLAADALSALMLTVTALVVLTATVFAAVTGDDSHPLFSPLVLVLSAGAYGAVLAADLFNLFVLVELMLAPSYALLALTGGRDRLAAARVYVAVSLLASTVLLLGIALMYGVTGTVNLGDLAAVAPGSRHAAWAGGLVLLALAVKAAVVPLHGWLPRSYPYAAPAVLVLFSGVLTKVAVYAIIRLFAVVHQGDPGLRWMFTAAALLTMTVGVLGAVGQGGMSGVLVFHMVSQIGYVLVGPALFTGLGLAAAIFYLVQYVPVKAALLMVAGAVRSRYGTDRLDRIGGLARGQPLLALGFGAVALSLAGMPPFSGFTAKLGLAWAATEAGRYLVLTVMLVVGLLTLLSMVKLWNEIFWGREWLAAPAGEEAEVPARITGPVPGWSVSAVVVLAALSLGLGVAAQPLFALAQVAADGLVDTTGYQQAVSGS